MAVYRRGIWWYEFRFRGQRMRDKAVFEEESPQFPTVNEVRGRDCAYVFWKDWLLR